MGRGAEAVNAEPRNLAGGRGEAEFQRAIADQSGAKKRRRFGVAIGLRQLDDEAGLGGRIAGVAAVDLIGGEARGTAEILPAFAAVAAGAVGSAEPRHADTVANG